MNRVEVFFRAASQPVAPAGFAPLEFLNIAVHSDEEDVIGDKQPFEIVGPSGRVQNMFDNQVVARLRIGGK